jgi:hypothetical protein
MRANKKMQQTRSGHSRWRPSQLIFVFSTRPRLATERAGRFANHRTRYGPATEGVAGDSLRLALDAQ